MSTSRGISWVHWENIMMQVRGYHEYIGRGYDDYIGGYHDACGGDITSYLGFSI